MPTPTTDILPFAIDVAATVQSQADYAAATSTAKGFAAGIADPAQLNKVWRQSSFVAAGLANWLVNRGVSVPDDGNIATLIANFDAHVADKVALAAGDGGTHIGFTQTGAGAIPITMTAKNQQVASVDDFGADPTLASDSHPGIVLAQAALGEMGVLFFPGKIYLTSDTIKLIDTDAYPGARAAGDDHFITIEGTGRESTWLLHTGAQTTGCVSILGNVFYNTTFYALTNSGQCSVKNIALGSTAGPALHARFANKMHHENVLLFSAGAASYSHHIESCFESTFSNVYHDAGNANIPYSVLQAIGAHFPGGSITNPISNLRIESIYYDDGTHGSLPAAGSGELFFTQCRSDGAATGNSVDIRGYASGGAPRSSGYIIKFSQSKFTQVTQYDGAFNPLTWVMSVNGAEVSLIQTSLEPNPGAHVGGSLRVTSGLGPSKITMYDCEQESAGMIDIGYVPAPSTGDNYSIDFAMDQSTFYRVRISTVATVGGLIHRLAMHNNKFNNNDIAGDGSFANIYNDGTHSTVTLVPCYDLSGNTVIGTGAPCLYQTSNCSPTLDNPRLRGGFIELTKVGIVATGFGIYYGVGAPTGLTAGKGSLYMRTDGSATNNRMYVNTDGATTWTAVMTAA